LLWPAVQHRLPGYPAGIYFIPAELERPVFAAMVGYEDWVSWPYVWRDLYGSGLGFLFARAAGTVQMHSWRSGLLSQSSKPGPFQNQQPMQVSGILGSAAPRALHVELGIETHGDTKLFCVQSLVKHCLDCSGEEVLNIISVRLGRRGCNKAIGAVGLLTLNDVLD